MSDIPIGNIQGWLFAASAFIGTIGLSHIILGARSFVRRQRGPFSNLFEVLFGLPMVVLSALQLFILLISPTMDFDLQSRLVAMFAILSAAVSLSPFIVLIFWAIQRQYSLSPTAPAPRWLWRWIEQQKRFEADSRERMLAIIEGRRQVRATRSQAR